MKQQREVDSRCMEPEIQQTFGNIQCGCALLALAGAVIDKAVKHELMLTYRGYGQFITILEALLYVVGTQGGQLSAQLYVLAAQHQDICIGSQYHAEIAVESRYVHTQERNQFVTYAYRTAAGTAASVRCGE